MGEDMKKCSVNGCDGEFHAKGFCSKHYTRDKRYSSPLLTASPYAGMSGKERLNARSAAVGDCQEWQRPLNGGGYGSVRFEGKAWMAHRLSYTLNFGPIPYGLQVLHRCDNPKCIKPSHLFLGSQRENMADMDEKGRRYNSRGEASGAAKLNNDTVLEIRAMHESGETLKALAKRFGVHRVTVGLVVRRRTWTHI